MVLALDNAHYPERSGNPVQKNEVVKFQKSHARNQTMNQRIAFFDFDGTITRSDTLLEFIKFARGPLRFYLGFALNSPWLVAYKLKLISNQAAKERILTWFFGKLPVSSFQEICDRFSDGPLSSLIRPKALEEVRSHIDKGAVVVIVSASPGNWISGWAGKVGASLIATRLETRTDGNERLTGRIQGANCYGEEKVHRILAAYNLSDYAEIYTYGDSSGDKPMLRLGNKSFYKPFR